MRHQCGNKKLGRPTDQRIAMLRAIVSALFTFKSIETTDDRAKQAKRIAERLITLGIRGDLHSRRMALKILPQKKVVSQLFKEIATQFKERKGGYTRIIKIGFRKGDAATISKLELIEHV